MIDKNVLLEGAKKDEDAIMSSSIVILAHLMKFVGADRLNTGWVGSIGSCWKNIRLINDQRFRSVESNLSNVNKITEGAKAIYTNDGNKGANDALENVLIEFTSLVYLKDWERLKSFMYAKASLRMDEEMCDIVLSYDPLKGK